MKFFYPYIKNYRKESVLAPLFKMLEALLELFVPLVIKMIIDRGIAGNDSAYTVKNCLLLVLIAAVGLGFSLTAQFFAAKAAVGFSAELKNSLFSHVLSLSYGDTERIGTSGIISRMTSDMNQLQNGINLTLRLLLRSPFVVFGAMIMAFTVDFHSALIFALTIPLLAAAVFSVMLCSVPLYKKVQSRLDSVLSAVRNTLLGARVLRAFGTKDRDIKDFREKNALLYSESLKAGRVSALLNPLTYVIINLAAALLIYKGALQVNSGELTQGAVVALYNYMAQISVELIKLANLIITITKAGASASRIKAVMEEKPSESFPSSSATPDFSAPAIEFSDVSFRYKGASEDSVKNASFTLKKGERMGIIGSTGSGKTSIISLIAGFYTCDEGSIRLFGNDIKSYSEEALRSLVSVCSQKAVIFSGSIRDNILFGNKNADEKELNQALSISDAETVAKSREKGLDAISEEGGKNFSGGEKQRIALARAIIKNSPILILDDCMSALDYATDKKIRQQLSSIPSCPALITVSQRISSVKNADIILVADEGRIADSGTHEELLVKSSIYKEIYDSAVREAEI